MKKGKSFCASMPRFLLRAEGLIVLLGALIFYNVLDGSWLIFALLFLLPDISFFGYFFDLETGAKIYNVFHTYLVPFFVFVISLVYDSSMGMHVAIIWFAHIGADRLAGYGFKYHNGFKTSHLKRV
ncbi:MAG: DUF4260 domain-containing protein [Nanoarchaeota archaeon]|nr:DUF4260 domain-containing protein [Nanoarchaeota archaeon]